jgi:hypothetical protein
VDYNSRNLKGVYDDLATMCNVMHGTNHTDIAREWRTARTSENTQGMYTNTCAEWRSHSPAAPRTLREFFTHAPRGRCEEERGNNSARRDNDKNDVHVDSDKETDEDKAATPQANSGAVKSVMEALNLSEEINAVVQCVEAIARTATGGNRTIINSFQRLCARQLQLVEGERTNRSVSVRRRERSQLNTSLAKSKELFTTFVNHLFWGKITTLEQYLPRQLECIQNVHDAQKRLTKRMKELSKQGLISSEDITHVTAVGELRSWEDVHLEIEDLDIENSPMFTPYQLLQVAKAIIDAGSVTLGSLCGWMFHRQTDRTLVHEQAVCLRILVQKHMPVITFHCAGRPLASLFVDIAHAAGPAESISARLAELSFKTPKKTKKQKKSTGGKKRGRPALTSEFPALIDAVRTIINRYAPEASDRRRNEVLRSGVPLGEIRDQLTAQFPDLRNIDKRTIARMMFPPRANAASAQRYKKEIQARVTVMQNNMRITNQDGHYSCAQMCLLKEISAWVGGKECLCLSADEKSKLVLGESGLVSRYHQNNKVTPITLKVNKFDHDYKYSQYTLCVSGFMELATPEEFQKENDVYVDTKGRDRVTTACTGKSHLWLRSTFHDRPDVDSNCSDLRKVLNKKRRGESGLPPVVVVSVDGGASYDTRRDATILLMGEIFKDFALEGLVLVRRAGGLSALNDVEHLWSPVSKKLAGTIISACIGDEDSPPWDFSKQPGGPQTDEDRARFTKVMDDAMTIVNGLLKGMRFDGHSVETSVVTCEDSVHERAKLNTLNGQNNAHHRLSSLNSINISTEKELLKRWVAVLRHLDFRMHAIIFTTCAHRECDWPQCKQKHKSATRFHALLDTFGGTLPAPCPNGDTGSYLTFLQMLALTKTDPTYKLPRPDHHLPSNVNGLEAPWYCDRSDPPCSKHFSYQSKTRRQRHDITLHSKERSAQRKPYKVVCKTCRASFRSSQALDDHVSDTSCEEGVNHYRYFKRYAVIQVLLKQLFQCSHSP